MTYVTLLREIDKMMPTLTEQQKTYVSMMTESVQHLLKHSPDLPENQNRIPKLIGERRCGKSTAMNCFAAALLVALHKDATEEEGGSFVHIAFIEKNAEKAAERLIKIANFAPKMLKINKHTIVSNDGYVRLTIYHGRNNSIQGLRSPIIFIDEPMFTLHEDVRDQILPPIPGLPDVTVIQAFCPFIIHRNCD